MYVITVLDQNIDLIQLRFLSLNMCISNCTIIQNNSLRWSVCELVYKPEARVE